MKIAYREKNLINSRAPKRGYCKGCIFDEEITVVRNCVLFDLPCNDKNIYQQLTKLDEIFKV